MSNTTASLDPFRAVGAGERHAVYAALTEAGPVHRLETAGSSAIWLVTGHAAARALLADPRMVKGGWRNARYVKELGDEVARAAHTHMLYTDPPDHGRLRRLVGSALSRRRVERMAPRIEQVTHALLTEAEREAGPDGRGPVDLVPALAAPLPIIVLCELIGIPEDTAADLRSWTPPLMAAALCSFEEYRHSTLEVLRFTRELIALRRAEPQDDLLSDLIAARDGADRLSEDELTSLMFLLLVAGHETTVHMIGNCVRSLLAHPDQLALVRERPELLEPAIEELLRYDGPLQTTVPYIATEPVDVAGVTIPPGEPVFIGLLAANRDPARFPGGDILDITRDGPAHIAFGHGVHHCVGAPLARLEARLALGILLSRFPRLRLAAPAGELMMLPSVLSNGLAALPVFLR
ncbi:hypothetical protein BKM31_29875 [[Actinomadura] parvosata subsp. kistnae]|uniref:Cytochrome n=1 Tax=[Actinomadura] parvosata subsp. kistnae TaxID=1909395 RepID=A0A1V0AKN0_9ACTN|nr:hypothetical protein BKM31_29875 [Nonomuraea sp. ATCC 55076]